MMAHSALDRLHEAGEQLRNQIAQLAGYAPRSLPDELSQLTGQHGTVPLDMQVQAFSAESVGYGRLARMTGPGTWVFNLVVCPRDELVLPVLGIEVLVFRGRVHLLVADLFPLDDDSEGLMSSLAARFDGLGVQPSMPDWARKIFSATPIFRKPGTAEAIEETAEAIVLCAALWFRLAGQPCERSPAARVEARRRRIAYLEHHLQDEPANPFLRRTFGDALGGRLVREVLFPVDPSDASASSNLGEPASPQGTTDREHAA
jgi:hypothetical protein